MTCRPLRLERINLYREAIRSVKRRGKGICHRKDCHEAHSPAIYTKRMMKHNYMCI